LKNSYRYAPYYCEENIWHLCQEEDFAAFERKVVLISNETRTCALWNQRARPADNEPVIWDYHVILLFENDGWQVYDLDTIIGAPIPLAEYVELTFVDSVIPEEFASKFRVVDATEFATIFSSDRSHMRTTDGQWQVPPPPWPAIVHNEQSNLMELIDMTNSKIGTVMNLSQFKAFFG
jgi:hypothetical protein